MLPRSKKINTQLFKEVFDKGKIYHFNYFFVKVLKLNKEEKSKFTVVSSKKITKTAITRNLLRRRFFNIIKEIYKELPSSIAIIFFLKKGAGNLKFEDLKQEIIKIFEKI